MSWAHVQGTSGNNTTMGGSTTLTLSLTGVSVGHTLILGIYTSINNSATVGVSDGVNTWHQGVVARDTSYYSAIYWTQVTTGGSLTVTMTFSANSFTSATLDEYSSTGGTVSISNSNGNSGTGTTPTVTGLSFSTTKALVVAAIEDNTISQTFTAGSGFTIRNSVSQIASECVWGSFQDDINATSSPVTASTTLGVSSPDYNITAAAFIDSLDGLAIGSQTLESYTSTTATVEFGSPSGGVAPYTIQCWVAPAPGGTPGTFVNKGTATAGTPFVITGLSPNTEYAIQQRISDSSTPTPQTATGSNIFFTTYSSNNYYLDNFHDTNGTALVGVSGHVSDSGAIYLTPTNQTANAGVIESNSPYNSSAGYGTNIFFQPNVFLGVNDPVSLTFTYSGAPGNVGFIGIGYRMQFNGTGYQVRFNPTDCSFGIENIDSSGNQHDLLLNYAFKPNALFGNGSYTMFACPFNTGINVYFQRNSDGMWLTPNASANTWSATKTVLFNATNYLTLTGGSPLLRNDFGSTGTTGAPVITQAAGGGNNIFLPTDLGCERVTDRFCKLTVLSAEGGIGTKTYVLQRKLTSGGSYSNIATLTPGISYVDRTVSASTGYTYRVSVTDSASNTVNSNTVSVTTSAAFSITPVVFGPNNNTHIITGTNPNDTSNNPAWLNNGASVFYDDLYQCYFAYGFIINNSEGEGAVGVHCYGYASLDLINWTPLGLMFTSTINGVTYTGVCYRPEIRPHPTNGLYYAFIEVGTTGDATTWSLACISATSPYGPFNTFVSLETPGGTSQQDFNILVDYDGTAIAYMNASDNAICVSVPLGSTWGSSYGTPNSLMEAAGGVFQLEGFAPFRIDRQVYIIGSELTGFDFNPNFAILSPQPLGLGPSQTSLGGFQPYANSLLFTTPAQAIAAPAGAPNGFMGSQTGIDPTLSYSSQSQHAIKTTTGQVIWLSERWVGSGAAGSSNIWLPINFDSVGQPTIPFVSSFIPSTGGSGVVGNLSSAQALAALAVLARSVQPPFINSNATGLHIQQGHNLVIPLSAGNINLGNNLVTGADSNNIYLGLVAGCPLFGYGGAGSPVGNVNTGGAGTGGLTASQILTTLAVLVQSAQTPFLTANQTNISVLANQLVIPSTTYNTNLGTALTLSTDGTYVYLGLNPGDPANGY